jgi:hypothetical protein
MDVGGEIRLGSALFTMVEPHRGHEVAYNRWYERDHFYAGCLVGPWLFAGRRWVATRDLKDLRFGQEAEVFGDVRRGSYLALYWVIDGKHDEHVRWALDQVKWLHANGRMFEARDHVHTLLYRYGWCVDGLERGVPPELALDHPHAGLLVTMLERAQGVGDDDVHAWVRDARPPALALGFAPIPLPPGAPVTQPGLDRLDRRTLVLGFTDRAPARVWDMHRDMCSSAARSGVGNVVWSSPFVPTVPGTDTYTDQLR